MSALILAAALFSGVGTDDLPTRMSAAPAPQDEIALEGFYLGARVGALKAFDAEGVTWFAGFQAGYLINEIVAIELSMEFHEDEYEDLIVDGVETDLDVQTYYLLISAVVTAPLSGNHLQLGGKGGFGWYYTRFEFDNDIVGSETDSVFGIHLGAILRYWFTEKIGIGAEILWHFVFEDDDLYDDEDADFIEFGVQVNFRF
jgi:hypothetical protein